MHRQYNQSIMRRGGGGSFVFAAPSFLKLGISAPCSLAKLENLSPLRSEIFVQTLFGGCAERRRRPEDVFLRPRGEADAAGIKSKNPPYVDYIG